jgi:hypothetical protein
MSISLHRFSNNRWDGFSRRRKCVGSRMQLATKKIGHRRIPDAVAVGLGCHPGDETGLVPSRSQSERVQLEGEIKPGSAFCAADPARSVGARFAEAGFAESGSASGRPASSGASTYRMMPV